MLRSWTATHAHDRYLPEHRVAARRTFVRIAYLKHSALKETLSARPVITRS